MKKIININFHSRVVPIEETAYEILQQYIDSLRRHFANEEGRDEIISDIENRFSELFAETLKKGAACITDADVNTVIASMGRPEDLDDAEMGGGTGAAASGKTGAAQSDYRQQDSYQDTGNEPRRLYRSENDKILGGVCGGLANYLRVDPSIVRIIFGLMLMAWGTGFLLYILMWLILPHKTLPVNLRKRLYRNPDDRVFGGVAGGLAAYFHIEVWVPRLIFALPLVASILGSILASIIHHRWFHFGGPAIFTGGFGFTLIISYIILWIVLPEALTASEKLEMKGEKVDIESIKNTIRNDLGTFKTRAKEMGSEMQDQFQKVGRQMKQGAQNFAAESGPAVKNTSNGIAHAIGVLFKAFFLFIAGCIVFVLIVALVALLFRGNGILTIKNYIVTGPAQNALVWASFFLFFVIPVIALLTWLIRRATGIRSRTHYLSYVFATLWIIGLFCLAGLAYSVMNNFQSRQHTEENIDLSQPSHAKLIIKSTEEKNLYGDDDTYIDDIISDNGISLNLNKDSFLNTVRVMVVKSNDSGYHVKIVKFGHGNNSSEARRTAGEIEFTVHQTDSTLYLPYAFPISSKQKFRNQQVMVILSVPIGKHIQIDNSVDHYNWFDINVRRHRIHWNRNGNDEWTDDGGVNWDNRQSWNYNVEYVMTAEGRLVDVTRPQTRGAAPAPTTPPTTPDGGGYRYKRPTNQEKQGKPDSTASKKSAQLQDDAGRHAETYLLSALLFQ